MRAIPHPAFVRKAVEWLRGGYPDGVPREDYVALLGVLHHRLSEDDIDSIADALAEHAAPGEVITPGEIRDMIAAHSHQQVTPEEYQRVSERLADAGWPLLEPSPVEEDPEEGREVSLVRRFVDWIRVGYPDGVPGIDHQPLLALLRRRLSEDEVREVCDALVESGSWPADGIDIGVEINKATNELPLPSDVARVAARLHDAGWPVEDGTIPEQ